MSFDFVIAGVGGQRIDRMVELIAAACEAAETDFSSTAPRGVVLLGGSRLAQISIGQCWSAIVTEDTGGLLLGLEIGEALRYAKYCARDGVALLDTLVIAPAGTGEARPYPTADAIESALREVISTVHVGDLRAQLSKAGAAPDLVYAMLVGAASRVRGLDVISGGWKEGLKEAKASEAELAAFKVGTEWAAERKLAP